MQRPDDDKYNPNERVEMTCSFQPLRLETLTKNFSIESVVILFFYIFTFQDLMSLI